MSLKRALGAFVVCTLGFMLGGCGDDPASTGPGGDIEIAGTWQAAIPGGPTLTVTITNDSLTYTGIDISATVIKYDNTANMLVIRMDAHPDPGVVGKYIKNVWRDLTDTSFTMDAYEPADDAAAAEAVTAAPMSIPMTKQ